MTPSEKIADFCEWFWAFQCHEFPLKAILAGAATTDHELLRAAPADSERRARFARSLLLEIRALAPVGLSTQERASKALLEHELNLLVLGLDVAADMRPTLYPLGPEFMFSYFAGIVNLQSAGDARLYLARLGTIPRGLEGVRESLEAGLTRGIRHPKLVVDRAVKHVRGQASIRVEESAFYGPFVRAGRQSEAFQAEAAQAAVLIRETVHPALAAYADFLEQKLGETARATLACTDAPLGREFYRSLVLQYATVATDPEEIHQVGLSEVERLSTAMAAVATDAGYLGDLAGFRRHLQEDKCQISSGEAELRERIEVLAKRIDAKIPQLFGRTPRTTYGVQSIPAAIADKMPIAYAQPNPADRTGPGVFWVTSDPSTCPRYLHLPITLHEAWPGHLMHLALIQEMQDLPAFRRYGALGYSACLEGWALYCERLGEEMGLYDTPEKRYGRLEMEMWRAVRLVLDTGIHWKNWTREQAVDFFQRHVAMPRATIEAEVDRYIGMPAQALAYQLGNLKFTELRRRAQAELGERFRIRDFHDGLMAAGPVTLPVLDDLLASA